MPFRFHVFIKSVNIDFFCNLDYNQPGKGNCIMWTFSELIQNFFTHKDFLPPADQLPGTLFAPLHFAVSACWIALIVVACIFLRKKGEQTLRNVFFGLWLSVAVLEIIKILWETFCGSTVEFEVGGILPLYPCSIFMYAMPFAIWGKGNVRYAACGYVCSLGLLGGAINFVYPANILNNYSCISFAGFHTLFYHGVMVLCAALMLLSGYHSYKGVTKAWQLLLPAIPALAISVVANLVNFSPVNSDYMFFKLNSFFFAPLGAVTQDWLGVILVYGIYLLIHALPYLPFFFANRNKKSVYSE